VKEVDHIEAKPLSVVRNQVAQSGNNGGLYSDRFYSRVYKKQR